MMLRLSLALLGICLAGAFVPPVEKFQPGYEFVYQYSGQVLSGVPLSLSQQYSGLKIKCHVRLQLVERTEAILQLNDIQLLTVNARLPFESVPRIQLPDDLCTPLEGAEAQLMRTELAKEIRFSYADGLVSHLESATDDPYWSVNIKRGVLNMFQINLNQYNEVVITPRSAIHSPDQKITKGDEVKEFYRVMEHGLSGECESLYTVLPLPLNQMVRASASNMPRIFVSKVRNLNKCIGPSQNFTFSLYSGTKCVGCPLHEKDAIQSAVQVKYEIVGTRKEFLIMSAIGESEYSYAPYAPQSGEAITIVNQTLILTDAKKTKEVTPLTMPPKTKQHQHTLKMSMPIKKTLETKPAKNLPKSEVAEKIQEIEQILKLVVMNMRQGLTKEAPLLSICLVKVLRSAPYQVLVELYSKYDIKLKIALSEEQKLARDALFDALAMVGTEPSIELIVNYVKSQSFPEERIPLFFNMLALSTIPTPDIIDRLLELSFEKVLSAPRLVQAKRSLLLTCGALIHKLFSYPEYNIYFNPNLPKSQINFINKLRTKYVRTVMKVYKKMDIEEKILALKVVGNTGLTEFIPFLREVITSEVKRPVLVLQAIYAMRRMAQVAPHQVQQILMPIVQRQSYPHDLRIAAYVVILDTRPSFQVIQSIVLSVNRERNLQVKSYIYSSLKAFSISRSHYLRPLAMRMRHALRLMKPFQPSIQYSKNVHLDYFNDYHKVGGAVELSIIGQRQSLIPRTGALKLNADILGYTSNVFEAGFETEGLQTLTDKLFKPAKRPSSSIHRHLKDINEKLHVVEMKPEEFKASVYLKLFGQELRFFTFDKTTVNKLIDTFPNWRKMESSLEEGYPLELRKNLLLGDNTLQYPTPIGLPLCLNISIAATVKTNGVMRMSLDPMNKLPKIPDYATADIKGHGSVAVALIASMGVDAVFLQTGVTSQIQLVHNQPINMSVTLNTVTQKFTTSIEPPTQTQKLTEIHVKPATFIRHLPVQVSQPISCQQLEIIQVHQPARQSQSSTFEYELPLELFGMKMRAVCSAAPSVYSMVPMNLLSTPQQIVLTAEPTSHQHNIVELNAQYGSAVIQDPILSSEPVSAEDSEFVPVDQQSSQMSEASEEIVEEEGSIWSPLTWLNQKTSYSTTPRPSIRQTTPMTIRRDELPLFHQRNANVVKVKKLTVSLNLITPSERITTLEKHYVLQYTPNCLKYQLNVDYLYSPISTENTPLHFNLLATLNLPQTQTLQEELPIESQRYQAAAKLRWGEPELEQEKQLIVKVIGQKSDYQKDLELRLPEVSPSEFPEYLRCLEDKRINLPQSPRCLAFLDKLNELHRTTIEVQYQSVPQWLRRMSHRLLAASKYMFYWDLTTKDTDIQNPPQKITLDVIMRRNNTVIDAFLRSPLETNTVRNISLPFPIQPISLGLPMYRRYLQYLTSKRIPAVCMLTNTLLRSFNNKVMLMSSPPQSEIIMAMDVTPSRLFAISTIPSPEMPQMRVVKIITNSREIEIIPTTEIPIVKVNNEQVNVPTYEEYVNRLNPLVTPTPTAYAPLSHHHGISEPMEQPLVEIYRYGSQVYITVPEIAVTVISDGLTIQIQASPLLYGKLNGICGLLNGNPEDLLMSPNQAALKSESDWLNSWSLSHSAHVHTPILMRDNEPRSVENSWEAVESQEEICEPVYDTLEIERSVRGRRELCVSLEPVQQCESHCKPVNVVSRKIRFSCTPVNKSQSSKRFSKSIKIPRMCEQI
ncbi:unnamed protein product [Owenia fusiformis]|uniref:Vitellogenin n=1 Tax=Owenia fusiformis TaxID=6347 RepID=A0A8S4N693_OWEFU|nr:unnamed protein product [Owenia fusiformis]